MGEKGAYIAHFAFIAFSESFADFSDRLDVRVCAVGKTCLVTPVKFVPRFSDTGLEARIADGRHHLLRVLRLPCLAVLLDRGLYLGVHHGLF